MEVYGSLSVAVTVTTHLLLCCRQSTPPIQCGAVSCHLLYRPMDQMKPSHSNFYSTFLFISTCSTSVHLPTAYSPLPALLISSCCRPHIPSILTSHLLHPPLADALHCSVLFYSVELAPHSLLWNDRAVRT